MSFQGQTGGYYPPGFGQGLARQAAIKKRKEYYGMIRPMPDSPLSKNQETRGHFGWFHLSQESLQLGPQIRVCNEKLFFLFLNLNICCGYSKELSH